MCNAKGNNRTGWLRAGWLVLLLGLGGAGTAWAQEAPRKAAPTKKARPRRPAPPPPSAYRPSYTRRGTPRKLTPEQLWDAVPDSTHPNRGPFRLLLYASLGQSIYLPVIGTPGTLTNERQVRVGLPITARALWQTDNRLRLGVESGFLNLYSYQGTIDGQQARVGLTAVPMLAVFSMSVVRRVSAYAGVGGYLIQSRLRYDGFTQGSTFSTGWMAAATYTQPLTRNLGLAAELKWYSATETNDACLIAQATLVWRALTW